MNPNTIKCAVMYVHALRELSILFKNNITMKKAFKMNPKTIECAVI